MQRRIPSGFTLIELMITVALISIIAAYAYPSYQSQVRSSRRADAQTTLLQAANFMERFFTENGRYDQDTSGSAVSLPYTQSPQGSSNVAYTIALTAVDEVSYTIRATPINTQATDGFMQILSTGVRHWDQDNNNSIGTGESDWEK